MEDLLVFHKVSYVTIRRMRGAVLFPELFGVQFPVIYFKQIFRLFNRSGDCIDNLFQFPMSLIV